MLRIEIISLNVDITNDFVFIEELCMDNRPAMHEDFCLHSKIRIDNSRWCHCPSVITKDQS